MHIKCLNKKIRLQYLYYKHYNRFPKILHLGIKPCLHLLVSPQPFTKINGEYFRYFNFVSDFVNVGCFLENMKQKTSNKKYYNMQ